MTLMYTHSFLTEKNRSGVAKLYCRREEQKKRCADDATQEAEYYVEQPFDKAAVYHVYISVATDVKPGCFCSILPC